ncbi:NAD-dependent epimerase [Hydrogenophaga crassostreae]|uniref:NAD-dependent epimerase n=1 Tax=Hydrogenophaga crassostreae TaxID=1763535 RepID=A0A167GTJ2_9BURK|nr:NAD-dependent epimerase/dehydratase family protein [Hydrogenophaga crassostreae]AOW11768.1 NAD-dependent epimerase [Hydrogenophaga crassostreae]OAD39861.1 NAD-dependent epimerase [Hydrogenophaga crassostreae]
MLKNPDSAQADALGSSYANRRVLITGGLGFIGSALAIELVRLGAKVTIVDSLLPEYGGNLFNTASIRDQVVINISDMRDQHSLKILVQGQDIIFHLAGQVSHGDSMREPELDLAVNCVSSMNLVEACRQRNPNVRLVYTSTRQVYGVPKNLPVTEDHPALPVDVNGINKLAAEYYHLLYHRTYDLKSTVLRLTNTYGPRQQIRNNRQGFIGIFIRQALQGEMIRVFGDGQQIRDFNYIDDVVHALLLAARCDACFGQVFNLGAPVYHTVLELVQMLSQLTGVQFELTPFPNDRKLIDIGHYYGDYQRFAGATQWEPTVGLEEGLLKSIDFYRTHRKEYWA